MKLRVLAISFIAAAIGMISSCKNDAKGVPSLSKIEVDSVEVDTTWEATDDEVYEYVDRDVKPGLKCLIQFPSASQAPELSKAYMTWLQNEYLGIETYDGDPNDLKGMLRYYVNENVCAEYGIGSDSQIDFEIRKTYENDSLITFVYSGYDYAFGAAHGMPYMQGVTFRKSTGERYSWDMFKDGVNLQPFLKSGLMDYFDTTEEEDLIDNLFLDEESSIDKLPLPCNTPWISNQGVELIYQPYEISYYAAGMPEVTIPMEKAKALLVPAVQECLK